MAFSILYQNVRGLRTKIDELRLGIESSDAKVICLTETWLNRNFDDGEFLNSNFISHRRDRSISSVKRGGGCMIIHSKSIKSMRCANLNQTLTLLMTFGFDLRYHPVFFIYAQSI